MDFLISKEALYFYTSVGMVLRVKPNRALLKFKRNSHFFAKCGKILSGDQVEPLVGIA